MEILNLSFSRCKEKRRTCLWFYFSLKVRSHCFWWCRTDGHQLGAVPGVRSMLDLKRGKTQQGVQVAARCCCRIPWPLWSDICRPGLPPSHSDKGHKLVYTWDGGGKEILNYGEERQLISPGPERCLANTLLCMKRKWQTLFYREVSTKMLTFTKLYWLK